MFCIIRLWNQFNKNITQFRIQVYNTYFYTACYCVILPVKTPESEIK